MRYKYKLFTISLLDRAEFLLELVFVGVSLICTCFSVIDLFLVRVRKTWGVRHISKLPHFPVFWVCRLRSIGRYFFSFLEYINESGVNHKL